MVKESEIMRIMGAGEKLMFKIKGDICYESALVTPDNDFDHDLMDKIEDALLICMKELNVNIHHGQMEIDNADPGSFSVMYYFETTIDIAESILENFEVLLRDIGNVDIRYLIIEESVNED
jgi:hypothetical protein